MTPITRVMKYFFAHPKPDMQWSKQIWEGTSLMSIPCFQWQTEGAWTTGLKFKFLNQDKGSCDSSDILTISSINFNMVSQTLKLFKLVDVKYFVNTYFVCSVSWLKKLLNSLMKYAWIYTSIYSQIKNAWIYTSTSIDLNYHSEARF